MIDRQGTCRYTVKILVSIEKAEPLQVYCQTYVGRIVSSYFSSICRVKLKLISVIELFITLVSFVQFGLFS